MKDNLKKIYKELKNIFSSKDKNLIINTIMKIIIVILVTIIIKIPIIFIKTLVLDFLTSASINMTIQNIISFSFELGYILLALLYIYKRFKVLFIKDMSI